MTSHDAAGRHVLVDFSAVEITPELERLIREGRIGGVILFAKNIASAAQVRRLTADLQDLAASAGLPPLFISIDQEGGMVNRLTDGVTVFPGAMSLGASGRPEDAATAGRMTALELRALGINVNHAPVLDVNTDAANPIIGVRSFGDDPAAVGRLGTAYAAAAQEAGILVTPKHFPGHGGTVLDSHLDLPTVAKGLSQLHREDIAPFAAAVAAGVHGLLTAHVLYPELDPRFPATLSPAILTTLLREEMGFDGVVFTDSMEMKAISARWGRGPAAVAALAAGADVIMACGPAAAQWEAIDAVRAAIEDGTLAAPTLARSADRIARAKTRYLGTSGAVPEKGRTRRAPAAGPRLETGRVSHEPAAGPRPDLEVAHGPESVPPPLRDRAAHEAAAQEIADRAVTLVRHDGRMIPLPAGRIAVLHVGTDAWVTAPPRLGEELAALHPGVAIVSSAEDVLRQRWDAVVVVSLSWRSHEGAATIAALHRAVDSRLVVVGAGNPYELARFPEVSTYLAAYGPDSPSMRAAARILAGRLQPRGRLPVAVPPLYARGHPG